jgi:hypothetical protein
LKKKVGGAASGSGATSSSPVEKPKSEVKKTTTTKLTERTPEDVKQNIQKVEVEISGNEKQAVSYDASSINVSGRVTVSERDDYGKVEVKGISSLEGKSEYPETVVRLIEHHTSPMQGSKSELGGAYELRNGKPIKSQKDFEQEIEKSINTLNTEKRLDDLVPIYLLRRSLGDRISRKDFDKFYLSLLLLYCFWQCNN